MTVGRKAGLAPNPHSHLTRPNPDPYPHLTLTLGLYDVWQMPQLGWSSSCAWCYAAEGTQCFAAEGEAGEVGTHARKKAILWQGEDEEKTT